MCTITRLDLFATPVPVVGKVVEVGHLPKCDLCRIRAGKSVSARFDCFVPSARRWGNLCTSCYLSEDARIGTGAGQILFAASESVRDVRADLTEVPGLGLLITNVASV